MHARQRVEHELINPATELLEAASGLVQEYKRHAERSDAAFEEMRPIWAQGWTSESVAAQASSNALAEIWALLGVTDQTAAMERLRSLLAAEAGAQ
jgi:hypothetical protein